MMFHLPLSYIARFIQRIAQPTMARPSTLASNPRIKEINDAILRATPVAMIATEFGISEASIYRWRNSHLGRSTLQNLQDKAVLLDYVNVATDSLRAADAVRRQGEQTNNANLVLKASLVINQLTRTIALQMGIDGSNTASLLADGSALTDALMHVIRETPGVATELVGHLRRAGQHDLAGELEDFHHNLIASPDDNNKIQEIAS